MLFSYRPKNARLWDGRLPGWRGRGARELVRAVAGRLVPRWRLGDDPTEPVPDHLRLPRVHDRYGLAVFRGATTEQ